MDLKNFFNILLLAISLTTILVTLVSYIVFKLRLSGVKKGKLADPLEGAFYRRYAPLIREKYLRKKASLNEETSSKVSVKVKFASLFVFLVLIVSGLFLFEDYFSYRKEISERVLAANNFRELVRKGFLKSYEYQPRTESLDIDKRISNNTIDQLDYLVDTLSDQNFCLISTSRAQKFSGVVHNNSLKQWIGFFKRNKLKYKTLKYINAPADCIVIFPHIHSLSRGQVAKVDSLKSKFLITGGFGVVDGLGGEVEQTLLEKYTGEKIQKEVNYQPSLISSEKDFLWEIDGGSFLAWEPLDNSYAHYYSQEGNIISSDYNGQIIKENNKVHSRMKIGEKALWTSLDPIDHPYSDLVFLNIFAKFSKKRVFKIENYKGSKSAVSFIYRQNSQSENLNMVNDTFDKLDSPWTLFTNNFNYEGKDIRHEDKTNYEVAVLTSPDHNFDKLDSRTAFNLVENIRLKLEELSYSGVIGLATYNNFINEVTLDSADQNKLSYLYGTIREVSYSPVFLKDLNYLLIPKMFRDSQELLNDKTITNISDLTKVFKTRLSDMSILGGLTIFEISATEIDNYLYKNSIKDIIKELKGKSRSLSDIISWKARKEGLKITTLGINGETKIVIENTSERVINNFKVLYHDEIGRGEFLIEKLGGNERFTLDPAVYRDL